MSCYILQGQFYLYPLELSHGGSSIYSSSPPLELSQAFVKDLSNGRVKVWSQAEKTAVLLKFEDNLTLRREPAGVLLAHVLLPVCVFVSLSLCVCVCLSLSLAFSLAFSLPFLPAFSLPPSLLRTFQLDGGLADVAVMRAVLDPKDYGAAGYTS